MLHCLDITKAALMTMMITTRIVMILVVMVEMIGSDDATAGDIFTLGEIVVDVALIIVIFVVITINADFIIVLIMNPRAQHRPIY